MVVSIVALEPPCGSEWCVVVCDHHECISVMHWLCMLALIYCYAYMHMVLVVLREVMVCG